MAAAVADYRPAAAARGQAQEGRDRRGARPAARAAPRTCSPALAARRRPGQVLVGFAAEHGQEAVEPQVEFLACRVLLELAGVRGGRPVVRDGGGHEQHVAASKRASQAAASSAAVSTST